MWEGGSGLPAANAANAVVSARVNERLQHLGVDRDSTARCETVCSTALAGAIRNTPRVVKAARSATGVGDPGSGLPSAPMREAMAASTVSRAPATSPTMRA